jgi:tetratricopeptide (TPR) repeat protein
VFHITGHASIQNNQPYFVTETETGERHPAKAEEIAAALRFRLPQLVFLSGCRTGEAANDGVVPSLAASLVEQGCKAVLGWGRPVSDVSATEAAAYLYSKLAAGYQLSEALASTYQHLLHHKVEDWHLLRLYMRGTCPGAFVEPLGDQVWLPDEPVHEQFLDPDGKVRVATPQEFVGRRRVLQHSLKALRSPDKLGVILHGLGGVGKSTVAARLLERLQGYDKIFIYKHLDQDKLLNQLSEQCLSEIGQEILQGKLSLMQWLTKFLREGLNQAEQRFIFVLDDFEANLELRADGIAVLKPEAVEVLMPLLKAISQSRLPHRLIITSRYDFQLPELNHRLYREQLVALSGADLQKKCDRLSSFSSKSEVDPELQLKAWRIADGNPRLLEWLNKILQVQHIDQSQILEQMEKASEDFRESILAEELLKQQPANLKRMLGFCLVYELPVPKSAIFAICPQTFSLDEYIPRSVALGLLEVSISQGETLYRVPRILEPLLDFPEDSESLYSAAAQHLWECWFWKIFLNIATSRNHLKESLDDVVDSAIPDIRLLEIYRLALEGQEPEILARCNLTLSVRWNGRGRYREVIVICRLTMQLVWTFRLFQSLAKAEEKLGEVESSFKHYQQALSLCPSSNEEEKADIIHALADLYASQGDTDKAFELLYQVLEIDERIGNYGGKAQTLNSLANIKHDQGLLEEALHLYQQAYELQKSISDIRKSIKDTKALATIRTNIATLQVELGQIDAWNQIAPELFEIHESSKDVHGMVVTLNNVAALRLKGGKLEESKVLSQKALQLLDISDDYWIRAAALHNLATICSEQGQYEQSLEFYKQALEIHMKNKNIKGEATTLREIGILHSRQKNFSKALELIQASHRLDESIENAQGQADALMWIASILIDQDNLEEAIPRLEKALKLYKDTNNLRGQAFAISEIGLVHGKQGKIEEAIAYVQQSLDINKLTPDLRDRGRLLALLGELLTAKGEVDPAIDYLQNSLGIYEDLCEGFSSYDTESVKKSLVDAQWKKSNILYENAIEKANQGNSEEAIELCEQSLRIAYHVGNIQGQAAILFMIGQLLVEQGNFEQGVEKLKKSLELSQELNIPEAELAQKVILGFQYIEIKRLHTLAQDKFEQGEIEETITLLERILVIAKDNKDTEWQSMSLVFLGQALACQGHYEIGINHLNSALAMVQEEGLEGVEQIQEVISQVQKMKAERLYQIAYSEAEQGQLEEAITLFRQALDFQRSIDYLAFQPATLTALGQLLAAQGKLEEGLPHLYEALNLLQQLQVPEQVERLQQIIREVQR